MYEVIDINGAQIIFSPFTGIETSSVGVFVDIGSRHEEAKIKGIAHFLEHMLFKGSKSYSYRKIKQEIEGRGGALNAFTSHEATGYFAHFLSKNLKPTLDILLDMVMYPTLQKEEIEKERRVILEELKMYNDLPSSRVVMLLDRMLWKNHPLGEEVIGDVATVKAITREDLAAFRDTYYQSPRMIIACSGSFPKEQVIKLVKEKIATRGSKVDCPTKAPAYLRGVHVDVEKKVLEQAYLCLGFRSGSCYDKTRYTIDIINVILGANMSSRLFEAIREKQGLCYDISTEARKYRDSGAFVICLGLDKSKILVALKSIRRELVKLSDTEVSLKELGRAKDYFLGQIAMELERPQGRMFYCAHSYMKFGMIASFDTIRKQIEGISPAQIKAVSKHVFNFNNMCVSAVGDFDGDLEAEIKTMNSLS